MGLDYAVVDELCFTEDIGIGGVCCLVWLYCHWDSKLSGSCAKIYVALIPSGSVANTVIQVSHPDYNTTFLLPK